MKKEEKEKQRSGTVFDVNSSGANIRCRIPNTKRKEKPKNSNINSRHYTHSFYRLVSGRQYLIDHKPIKRKRSVYCMVLMGRYQYEIR